MDRLTEMEAFVQVVDHGGFTEAARRMRLSKSAVSKHVSALEARLGARLLALVAELTAAGVDPDTALRGALRGLVERVAPPSEPA